MSYTSKQSATEEYIPYRHQQSDKSFLYAKEAAVIVPVLQSLGTGLAAFVTLSLLGLIWRWRHVLEIAVTVACILFVAYWLYALWRWNLVSKLEEITGIDLNGDSHIGQPSRPPVMKLRISNTSDGRYSQTDTELPVDPGSLVTLATALLNGRPLSSREWSGSGKLFSDPQWRKLTEIFLARGIFQLKNEDEPRQGFELSEEGQAVMEEIAAGNVEILNE